MGGCGSEDESAAPTTPGAPPEASGTLRITVPSGIETIDPLLADGPAERLASRQVYEPLLTQQSGPFGLTRQRPGLTTAWRTTAGDTIWTATLRRGVRFADGEPFDADAVVANAQRWLSVAPELVPELAVAFSPRPGVVSFQLDRAAPQFARRLASARLGIVAPDALAGLGAAPLPSASTRSGTGPFELRERETGRTLLARNPAWWGTPLGLGPGVDQIELIDDEEAVEQLLAGTVEVAAELDPAAARRVGADPLLTIVRRGGTLGMERSVRGIESAQMDQPLADAWLTDLRR